MAASGSGEFLSTSEQEVIDYFQALGAAIEVTSKASYGFTNHCTPCETICGRSDPMVPAHTSYQELTAHTGRNRLVVEH